VSFARLIDRFKQGVCPPESKKPEHDPLPLATAAVLLDIGYADGTFTPAEDGNLVEYLKNAFHLDETTGRELMEAAAEIRAKTIDYFAITNYLRKNMSLLDRIEIVKTMWRMVYSDGRLTDYENYLVRKLADLLGLEHHVMIEAKVGVLKELGLATG
jgi:uncharacterized tellurite resistance protein B-like protein